MRPRAFTLIELLVVVAVIATLIGILLPSLAAGREAARSTRCLSALHDVGTALQCYFNCEDDRFPLSQAHGGYQPGTAWLDTLAPHTELKLQYRCPSDRSINFDSGDPAQRRVTSYGVNVFMGPNDEDWFPDNPSGIPPFGYVVQTQLRDTSRWVYSAEIAEVAANGQPLYADHFHAEKWGTNPFTGFGGAEPRFDLELERHRGRSNYLFTDGHADRHRLDELFLIDVNGWMTINRFDPGFPHSPEGWYRPSE